MVKKKMNKQEAIKQTVNTAGWKIIKEGLLGELINSPLQIKTTGKSNQEIAREVTAQEMAAKRVNSYLNKIDNFEIDNKKNIYT